MYDPSSTMMMMTMVTMKITMMMTMMIRMMMTTMRMMVMRMMLVSPRIIPPPQWLIRRDKTPHTHRHTDSDKARREILSCWDPNLSESLQILRTRQEGNIFNPTSLKWKKSIKIQTWYLSKKLHDRSFWGQNFTRKSAYIATKANLRQNSVNATKCQLNYTECANVWRNTRYG